MVNTTVGVKCSENTPKRHYRAHGAGAVGRLPPLASETSFTGPLASRLATKL